MSLDMVCNFRKCRKSLSGQAWVTTCSHAFCVEHGKREFKRNGESAMGCPACGTELREKFDVIQADLRPSETFKSIVLAGMKPDIIMDVAMRAMSFWSYQVEQETLYQESLAKHTKEKLQCFEELHTLNMQKLKAELDTCKRKINSLQAEFNKKRKQADELTARLEEKSRKIQKLTFQLEAQKRKGIHVNSEEFEQTHDNHRNNVDVAALIGKRANSEAFVFRPAKDTDIPRVLVSPKTPMFDFRTKKKHQNHSINFEFRPMSS